MAAGVAGVRERVTEFAIESVRRFEIVDLVRGRAAAVALGTGRSVAEMCRGIRIRLGMNSRPHEKREANQGDKQATTDVV
jgi:hypothetical protein